MQADIGHAFKLELALVLEIGIIQERPAIDEILRRYRTGRSTLPLVCARYGRHARGRKLQWTFCFRETPLCKKKI